MAFASCPGALQPRLSWAELAGRLRRRPASSSQSRQQLQDLREDGLRERRSGGRGRTTRGAASCTPCRPTDVRRAARTLPSAPVGWTSFQDQLRSGALATRPMVAGCAAADAIRRPRHCPQVSNSRHAPAQRHRAHDEARCRRFSGARNDMHSGRFSGRGLAAHRLVAQSGGGRPVARLGLGCAPTGGAA